MNTATDTALFYLGNLVVDPMQGSVSCGDKAIQLEPLIMKVLVSLAHHHPEVLSKEQLLAEVWGHTVVSDDAISRSVYQLRKSLARLLKDSGAAADRGGVIKTLRKRGYQLRLPVWTSPPDQDQIAGTHKRHLRWPLALVVVALIGLVWIGLEYRERELGDQKADELRRVAVVPFESLSTDPEIDFLTRGLSEELSHALANAKDLRVTAHSSSLYLRNSESDLNRYFEELDVAYLVRGSVRHEDNNLRITVQVINAEDRELFSRVYERKTEDQIQIQKQIAHDVIAAVSPAEANDDQDLFPGSTEDVAAYDHYVRGRINWKTRNGDKVLEAIDLFEAAIARDPAYALAYSGLADAYSFSLFYSGKTVDEIATPAKEAVDEALRLSPDLPQAYASQGLLYYVQKQYDKADNALLRAIELGPNYVEAYTWRGLTLVISGDYQKAHEVYVEGAALDPLNATLQMNIGANLMVLGRFDEGISSLRRAAELSETKDRAEFIASHWSMRFGRLDDALYWGRRAHASKPDSIVHRAALADALVALGRFDEARFLMVMEGEPPISSNQFADAFFNYLLASGDRDGLARLADRFLVQLSGVTPLTEPEAFRQKVVYLNWLLYEEFSRVTDAAQSMDFIDDPVRACASSGDSSYAVYLASAFEQTGDKSRAAEIVNLCLATEQGIIERGSGSASPHFRIAALHALAGDDDLALASLELAYDKGWRAYWVVRNDPIWASRMEREPFRAFFDRVRQDVEQFNAVISAREEVINAPQ